MNEIEGDIENIRKACLTVAQNHESTEDKAFCSYLLGVAAMMSIKREVPSLFVQVAQEANDVSPSTRAWWGRGLAYIDPC